MSCPSDATNLFCSDVGEENPLHPVNVPAAFCLFPFCALSKEQANAAVFNMHFSQHIKTVISFCLTTFSSGDGD